MSLKSAIERARKGTDHSESMGLGFEMAEFPEIEEGVHLFNQIAPWLIDRYPGRVVSRRLECNRPKSEPGFKVTSRNVHLEEEILIQGYRDLVIFEDSQPYFDFGQDGARLVLFGPKEEVELVKSNCLPVDGWKFSLKEEEMRVGGGLFRLRFRLSTNRDIWSKPRIGLETGLMLYRIKDGVATNIADVQDSEVGVGGLERVLARVLGVTITPALDQKLGMVSLFP